MSSDPSKSANFSGLMPPMPRSRKRGKAMVIVAYWKMLHSWHLWNEVMRCSCPSEPYISLFCAKTEVFPLRRRLDVAKAKFSEPGQRNRDVQVRGGSRVFLLSVSIGSWVACQSLLKTPGQFVTTNRASFRGFKLRPTQKRQPCAPWW